MSRNASGTHSLPTGNPVVAGTIADPVVHNATMTDLSTEITDSLSRSGKGGMTAPLVVVAGSATAPSIAPTGDPNTGIYAPAADELAITTGGTQRLRASSAGVNVTGAMAATGAVSGTTGTFTGAVGAAGGSMTAALAMGANKITGLADGTDGTDAATVAQSVTTTSPSITWSTDWADYAAVSSLSKSGHVVAVTIQAKATVGAATWASIATLPVGCRPPTQMEVVGALTTPGAVKYLATFTVSTGGVIAASTQDDGTSMGAIFAIATNAIAKTSFSFVVP